jgi:hypothetical protein
MDMEVVIITQDLPQFDKELNPYHKLATIVSPLSIQIGVPFWGYLCHLLVKVYDIIMHQLMSNATQHHTHTHTHTYIYIYIYPSTIVERITT